MNSACDAETLHAGHASAGETLREGAARASPHLLAPPTEPLQMLPRETSCRRGSEEPPQKHVSHVKTRNYQVCIKFRFPNVINR